jgi:hypothetical protein
MSWRMVLNWNANTDHVDVQLVQPPSNATPVAPPPPGWKQLWSRPEEEDATTDSVPLPPLDEDEDEVEAGQF